MTDRATRALELFQRAAGLGPEERAALLDGACGDDHELRRAVEVLFEDKTSDIPLAEASSSVPQIPTAAEASVAQRLVTGDRFAGRYRIVSLLGRGAMGEVYRAHDTVLDVEVAIKLVLGYRPEFRDRLIKEVRLAREVTHPAVCRVFDVGAEGDQLYFTMEYVDGEDLSSLLARIGRLPSDKVVEIAHQVCAGLAAAHAKGVIHRDLKPANIMVDGRGEVRITDFGIAVMGDDANRDGLAGTPAYMAPEQLNPDAPVGPAADIYAVGLILHELLTGKKVFSGSSFTEIFRQKVRTRPEPPSEMVDGVDPRLEEAVIHALARSPEDRPLSALAMAAELPGGDPLAMAVAAGAVPKPELVAAATAETPFRRSNPMVLLAVLVALLVGVLVLSGPSATFHDTASMVPPEVLADRSQKLLSELGSGEPVRRGDWGFLDNVVAADPIDRVLFWHRWSVPKPLPPFVERAFEASSLVRGVDVPETFTRENLFMMLDPTGDLVYLNAGAPFGSRVGGPASAANLPDWDRLFESAGLDRSQMIPEADVAIPIFADRRAAWTSEGESGSGATVRVQAAAFDGRPVYFAAETMDPESHVREHQLRRRLWLDRWIRTPLYVVVVLAALGLGVQSILRERSDLRGAVVLAATVLVVGVLASAFTAGRVRHPLASSEMTLLRYLVDTVIGSMAVGLVYVGLEPLIRRHRPQALIAWSRLLAGNPGNEAVGLSLLVGSLAGSLWAILQEVDRITLEFFGLDLTWGWLGADQLNAATSLGTIFGTALREVEGAIVGGLLTAVLFVLVARLIPRQAVVWIVFTFVAAIIYGIDAGAHLPASVLTLGLAVGAMSLAVLHRFGLLALVVATLCDGLLIAFPMSWDRGVWFAQAGYFAIALVLAVGVFGLLLVRSGRRSVVPASDLSARVSWGFQSPQLSSRPSRRAERDGEWRVLRLAARTGWGEGSKAPLPDDGLRLSGNGSGNRNSGADPLFLSLSRRRLAAWRAQDDSKVNLAGDLASRPWHRGAWEGGLPTANSPTAAVPSRGQGGRREGGGWPTAVCRWR